MEENELIVIKQAMEELLAKMTLALLDMQITQSEGQDQVMGAKKEVVEINLVLEDPQMLIGQNGKTLFEFGRLARILLNKKLKKDFYVALDINDYKKKKIEYIKDLAKAAADQVARTGQPTTLPPMPAYERRLIHAELSLRQDVATESQGEGEERCVVIRPR